MNSSDRTPDEQGATTSDGPFATPLSELRAQVLEHYSDVSSASCSWMNTVPRAINFYFDAEERRIARPAPVETGTREAAPACPHVDGIPDCELCADEAHASATLDRDEGEGGRTSRALRPCFTCGFIESVNGTRATCVRCLTARVAYLEAALRKITEREGRYTCEGRTSRAPLMHAGNALSDIGTIVRLALAGTWRDEE